LIKTKGVILAAPCLHENGRDPLTGAPAGNNAVHYASKAGHVGIIKAVIAELEYCCVQKPGEEPKCGSKERPPESFDSLKNAIRAYLSVPVRIGNPLIFASTLAQSSKNTAFFLLLLPHSGPRVCVGRIRQQNV